MSKEKLIIYADGGSRNNPGPAAFGFVIYNADGELLFEKGECIGINTNNVAEYMGLIKGLESAVAFGEGENIEIRMDSQLAIRQMKGEYKIKQPHLRVLASRAALLCKKFSGVTFTHVPREENKAADKMVNLALDGKI